MPHIGASHWRKNPHPGTRRLEARRIEPGACPYCGKKIQVLNSGVLRYHTDSSGLRCAGAGMVARENTYGDVAAPPVAIPRYRPRSSKGDRGIPNSAPCPECGRQIPLVGGGVFKKHRPVADTFAGPHCAGSGAVA